MRHLSYSLLLCSLLACGPSEPPDDGGTPLLPSSPDSGTLLPVDAGQENDAGTEADAGVTIDAGTTVDAGTEVDAGTTIDAGVEVDAGATIDAGVEVDAGTTIDAGTEVDAGTTIDAGITIDAGTPVDAGVDAGCMCTASEYCSLGVCVVDATPPQLTVTASAGPTPATLRLTGTARDLETGLSALQVTLNTDAPITVPVTMGTFDLMVPTPAGRAEYTIVALARDRAGNVTTAQTTFDAAAPTLTLLTPALDGTCTATACTGAIIDATTQSLSVTATVVDGLGLAAQHPVQARVLNGAVELVAWSDLTSQGNNTWAWTWSLLPMLDFTQLTLEVAAVDAANNRSTTSRIVLLDRVRPSLAFTPSTNASCTATGCTGAIINLATTAFELSGLVSTDASLKLRVADGPSEVIAPTAVPASGGAWTWAWTTFPALDGRYLTIEVTATDALFNSSTRQLTVLVDRTTPALVVTSPQPGALVGTAEVTITSTALDALGIKRVEASPGANQPFVAATRQANGDMVVSLPVPQVDAVEQTITLRAIDLVDNQRTVTTRYVADRVAPRLTVAGTDFNCGGPGACTGSVLNAAMPQLSFNGTVTDNSAVRVKKTMRTGTTVLVTADDAITGTTWSWTWSTPRTDLDGVAHDLVVVATDAAGNSSAEVVRRSWVDVVAPKVTVPVAGQRNVDPTGTLLSFSEPMNVATVVAATTLSPSGVTVTSVDGQDFKPATALSTYTPYTLTLANTASDRAGNRGAAATGSFLTAIKAQTFPMTLTTSSQPCQSPRVAVDEDGRFTVAYSCTGATPDTLLLTVQRDTGSALQSHPVMLGTRDLASDLRLVSNLRGADQRLAVSMDLAVVSASGSGTNLIRRNLTTAWNTSGEQLTQSSNAGVAMQALPLATMNRTRPGLDYVPSRNLITGGFVRTPSFIAPNPGATTMQLLTEGATPSAIDTLTSLQSFDGRASVDVPNTLLPNRIRYWDLGGVSLVGNTGFVRAATAQPAIKGVDRLGMPVNTSPSFIAWTTDTELRVACSAAPFTVPPTWLTTVQTLPSRRSATPISSAMNASTFVVAGEYDNEVRVFSTPVSCSAAPVLTEVARIPAAKDPGVTIDPAGRVWVTWIDATNNVKLARY